MCIPSTHVLLLLMFYFSICVCVCCFILISKSLSYIYLLTCLPIDLINAWFLVWWNVIFHLRIQYCSVSPMLWYLKIFKNLSCAPWWHLSKPLTWMPSLPGVHIHLLSSDQERHLWWPKYFKFPCVFVSCVLSSGNLSIFLVCFPFLFLFIELPVLRYISFPRSQLIDCFVGYFVGSSINNSANHISG